MDSFGIIDAVIDLKTMKDELHNIGSQIPPRSSYLEVRQVYEELIVEKNMDLYIDQIHEFRYPTLSTNNINSKDFSIKWRGCVGDVGEVLCRDSVTSIDIGNIIHLFAELVRFDESKVTGKRYSVHSIMPAILTEFCIGSRVHSGLRLMKRAARHSIYQQEPDVRKANMTIGYYKGSLYFQIEKHVAASYHKKISAKTYKNTCVFSEKALLCTHCSCRIGANLDGECSALVPFKSQND